jgi:integrase
LEKAGLRSLRFHDLRHTFGTQVIGNPNVSILQLKEWMGHADIDTTMKYLHFAPRAGDADLVAHAFGMPGRSTQASADAVRLELLDPSVHG